MATRKNFLSVFMDLSKAFDTINHDILITKLRYYGFSVSAANLIKSYLSDRSQFVVYKGIPSDLLPLKLGVPQGSKLGPLLFIIYINDINICSNVLHTILYADDSTFSVCLDTLDLPDCRDQLPENMLNTELNKVSGWLKANHMCLNVKKTKFMIFSRTHSTQEINLYIDGINLEQVETFNFLGLLISENMNWTPHLNMISRKLSKSTGILSQLKFFVPRSVLRTIYFSLIHPHLTYQILAWGSQSKILFPYQKKAIRIINNEHFLHHTDPLFKQSRILKLSDLYTLEQLKFYHRQNDGLLPHYFQSLIFPLNRDFHNYSTRSADELRPSRPFTDYSRCIIRNLVPKTVNSISTYLYDALLTKSKDSFVSEFKKVTLQSYNDNCNVPDCYPCSRIRL